MFLAKKHKTENRFSGYPITGFSVLKNLWLASFVVLVKTEFETQIEKRNTVNPIT